MAEAVDEHSAWVVTGVMAAGKSTVADLLAQSFERSAHVRGDVFRRMIVTGRAPLTPPLGAEDVAQLELRRHLAASTVNEYWRAGFSVVVQDILIGSALTELVAAIDATPLYVVVLDPRPDVVAAREAGRAKTGYGDWSIPELSAALRAETPRVGLWLDSSDLTAEATVDAIRRRRHEAQIR